MNECISKLVYLYNSILDTILPILDVFRIAILNSDINKFFCLMKPEANSIRGRETLLKLMAYLV